MQCYLCKGNKFSKKDWVCRDNTTLAYWECNNCSLVQLPNFDHISDTYYEDSGMHNFEDDTINSPEINNWLKETLNDDDRRFKYFKKRLIKKDVLDFGCGCGGFLSRIKDLANSSEGIELEKRLQPFFAKEELVVYQSTDQIPTNKKYDLITSFHVFEHLKDPIAILKNLVKYLKDDGEIIIEVPNSEDALLSLYKSVPFLNFHWSQHLFVFNQKTLEDLGIAAGMEVVFVKQVQRYSLANHLYWLSNGMPGGHQKWDFIDSEDLDHAYENQLGRIGKCDTIMICLKKKNK
jgi:2-polyprenyl-3-methyl-5-hydroxy-6-metoxy-1,4-benzoquinol methylase